MALQTITQVSAPRVTIRPVNDSDLNDLFEVNGDDAVTRYLPYQTWQTIEQGTAWLARMEALATSGTGQQLVIERNEDRKVIGTILLFSSTRPARVSSSATSWAAPIGAGAMRARHFVPSANMPFASFQFFASRLQ